MKIKCGRCDSMYKIEINYLLAKAASFKCEQCNNKFFISKDFSFSSTSKNSKIICEKCGAFLDEGNNFCETCNLGTNRQHEDLRIDNYFYSQYSVNKNGKIVKNIKNANKYRWKIIFPVAILCGIIAILSGILIHHFLPKTSSAIMANSSTKQVINAIIPKQLMSKSHHVVIMKNGKTYYANTVENDGLYLKLVSKNGLRIDVLEKDVLQISKATIE